MLARGTARKVTFERVSCQFEVQYVAQQVLQGVEGSESDSGRSRQICKKQRIEDGAYVSWH